MPSPNPWRRSPRVAPAALVSQRAAVSLSEALPVHAILGAQLTDVVRVTEEAAIGFLDWAFAVDEATGRLAVDVAGLARTAVVQRETVVRLTEDNLRVAASFDELMAVVTTRDAAVLRLVNEVKSLDQQVDAIRAITRATNILALNAKIEGARAGAAGAGFRVVANEVQEFSRTSDQAAAGIGAGIARLTAMMEAAIADGATGTANRLIEQMRAQQQHSANELLAGAARVHEVVDAVEQSTAHLSDLTTQVVGGVQFQDVTRQAVEHVVGALEVLSGQLDVVRGVLVDGDDPAGLDPYDFAVVALEKTYVMHSQREVHAATMSDDDVAAAGLAIELF